MPSVSLSIVIVTWNGLAFLDACLSHVAAQMPPDAEILVVDNGSTDGTVAWLKQAWPAARVIALPDNLGFAGGVNVGLRAARGEYLLLLNNDAFVYQGCVTALMDALAHQPKAGAAAGVLTFEHRPDLVASAGIVARRDGVALDLWVGRPVATLPSEVQPILGASGGLALLRRSMLDDIGLMDSSFFSYLEDADLAWRALLRGWECILVPTARARHIYSATAGQGSRLKQLLLGRNRLRAVVRCFPGGVLRACAPAILAYDAMAIAYAMAAGMPAMIEGRLAAWRERSALIAQRRAIQSRRTIADAAFWRWLEPPPRPWEALRFQRRLDAILRDRG